MKKMPKKNSLYAGDVMWYIPKRKRAVAFSTKATSDYIVVLASEHKTIQDVYDTILWNDEARRILKIYIDCGYGGEIARDWFG